MTRCSIFAVRPVWTAAQIARILAAHRAPRFLSPRISACSISIVLIIPRKRLSFEIESIESCGRSIVSRRKKGKREEGRFLSSPIGWIEWIILRGEKRGKKRQLKINGGSLREGLISRMLAVDGFGVLTAQLVFLFIRFLISDLLVRHCGSKLVKDILLLTCARCEPVASELDRN